MTNAPIDPRHEKDAERLHGLRVMTDSNVELAQALANLEAARADLAEIDRIAEQCGWNLPQAMNNARRVAAIAAPYRASDPVAEALKAAVYAYGGEAIEGENFDSAVAVLRAFIEGDR